MKKLLIIFGCLFSIIATAQQITVPFEFPIKPGSKEWSTFTSSKQMDEVCVIPYDVLKELTTNALLITCLHYPRLIDIFMDINLQKGFDFYSSHFNGLTEFINRPDAGENLFKTYLDLDIEHPDNALFNFKLSAFQVALLEILIAQEKIISGYNSIEIELLLNKSRLVLEKRQSLGESLYKQKTSAFIISRVLSSENKNLSEYDKNGNDIFKIFNSHAILADSTIINKLLITAKEQFNK